MMFQENRSFAHGAAGLDGCFAFTVDTRGNDAYEATLGRGIVDMTFSLSLTASSNMTIPGFNPAAIQMPRVDLVFHEVNSEEEYFCFKILGATSFGQVGVSLECETELTVDNTSEIGTYITATPEKLVGDVDMISSTLSGLAMAAGHHDQRAFQSLSFKGLMNKASKVMKTVAVPVLKVAKHLPGPYGRAAGLIEDGLDGKFGSVGFGEGVNSSIAHTKFSFPIDRKSVV